MGFKQIWILAPSYRLIAFAPARFPKTLSSATRSLPFFDALLALTHFLGTGRIAIPKAVSALVGGSSKSLKVSQTDQRVSTRNVMLGYHRPIPAAIGD
jgi:hypothetical protein